MDGYDKSEHNESNAEQEAVGENGKVVNLRGMT
jgi:hypothetical protein